MECRAAPRPPFAVVLGDVEADHVAAVGLEAGPEVAGGRQRLEQLLPDYEPSSCPYRSLEVALSCTPSVVGAEAVVRTAC